MDIKSSKKFLGNSQFKQLCHMTSELIEVWVAWIIYKINPSPKNKHHVCIESVDLQSSTQTFLEGPMEATSTRIEICRMQVIKKNTDREGGSYYE